MSQLSIMNNGPAKQIWVSFGIFMTLLPFLDKVEIYKLQASNKFCYSIAISRVQLQIQVSPPFYLIDHKRQ